MSIMNNFIKDSLFALLNWNLVTFLTEAFWPAYHYWVCTKGVSFLYQTFIYLNQWICGCIQIQCSLCLVWKVLQIVPRTQSCEFHQKVWSNKFLLMILVPGLQCFAFQKLFAGGLKLLRKSSNKYKILLRNSLMPPFKANQIHVAGEASQQK